jgi:protein-tyrosine phosphatase
MVAGLLTQRLDAAGLGNQVIVRSAGTYAESGKPAWAPMRELMAARGVDLQRHRSQPVSSDMVQSADLIIVMEERQRQSIFYLEPRVLHKVFLLSEMAGDADPLWDVMGQPLEEVCEACDQAEAWLAAGWTQLLARLSLVEVAS